MSCLLRTKQAAEACRLWLWSGPMLYPLDTHSSLCVDTLDGPQLVVRVGVARRAAARAAVKPSNHEPVCRTTESHCPVRPCPHKEITLHVAGKRKNEEYRRPSCHGPHTTHTARYTAADPERAHMNGRFVTSVTRHQNKDSFQGPRGLAPPRLSQRERIAVRCRQLRAGRAARHDAPAEAVVVAALCLRTRHPGPRDTGSTGSSTALAPTDAGAKPINLMPSLARSSAAGRRRSVRGSGALPRPPVTPQCEKKQKKQAGGRPQGIRDPKGAEALPLCTGRLLAGGWQASGGNRT